MAFPLRQDGAEMIQETSTMDRAVGASGRFSRRQLFLVAGLALVVIVALALPAIRNWTRADRAVDSSTVRIAVVSRGDLHREAYVQARVVAALHPTLFSPAQGVVSMRVKAGSEVKEGDILAIIESGDLRSAVTQAEAQLASLQADLERQKIITRQSALRGERQIELLTVRLDAAKRALERAQTVFREGIGNRAELETAQDGARVAAIELEQARKDTSLEAETLTFELRNREEQVRRQHSATAELRKKADELTVRAPFDGIVAQVAVQDRDAVAPNQSIVTVVNLSSFELEMAVPEEYAGDTRIGTPASIHFGNGDFEGRVTAVSPEVVNGQVMGMVAFTAPPPAGLKQSQRLTVRLLFGSRQNVLKVARGGFADAGGRTAYVVSGNLAQRRAIALGDVSATEVEITSGLREGERVITSDISGFNNADAVLLR